MAYWRFEIPTALPPDAVAQRLLGLARPTPDRTFRFADAFRRRPADAKPFIGIVVQDHFYFYRDIRYRNSFLPRLIGRFGPGEGGGTRVRVTASMHPLIIVFMTMWLVFSGKFAVDALASGNLGGPNGWIAPTMFVFGLLLPVTGFVPEALKARRLLREALTSNTR